MENKYYIPELEDFSYGLEYEIVYSDTNAEECIFGEPDSETDWIGFWNKSEFIEYLNEGKIRVKYLDGEDIMSCGFSLYGFTEKTLIGKPVLMYHNEELNLMLGFYYEDYTISIATKDPSKNEIFLKTNQDPNRTGFLKIKNKTELKKILKMLNKDETI